MIKVLYRIIGEFPGDVFFIKGNNECMFYDIFFYRQENIKIFLKFLYSSLLLKSYDKTIFCSHGGIPVFKDKRKVLQSCQDDRRYNINCIFNYNEFSIEKGSFRNHDKVLDSFRGCGCIVPNCIELFFLKTNNIDFCISGHVHKNQCAIDKEGKLRHITICSSKKLRSGPNIPTAYVIFSDGTNMFLNLDDFTENQHIENSIFE